MDRKIIIFIAQPATQKQEMEQKVLSQNGWIVSNLLEDVTYNKSDKNFIILLKMEFDQCLVMVKN